MENNHLRNVTERKPGGPGTLSPHDFLCKLDSCKRPSFLVVRTLHDQVSRSAIAMSFDEQLETIPEDSLICFDWRRLIPGIMPDLNIATENRSFGRGTDTLKSIAEPVALRATIGVDEGDDITGREPNSGITRGAGSRLQ